MSTRTEMLDSLNVEDWATLREAVERAGDWLKTAPPDGDLLAAVGQRLVALAAHSKWEVRKEVAHAVQYLRHETFHAALARLLDDDNSWVRDAAQRALARRTELTRSDLLREQHGDLMLRWLAELEGQHGPRAREAAMRVAERYTELVVREAYHEVVKVISPLELSLTNLETSLGRARIDRDTSLKHVHRAQERLKLLQAIIDSLRAFTTEVTPEFRGESIRKIIEEAVTLVVDRMGKPAKRVAVELVVDRDVVVDAYRPRLLQAFLNIIQNAVEAFDDRRNAARLRIGAQVEDERRVVIVFEDNGCGMGDEALRDAFRLFASKKPNGTGFGLPLAKKIIETEHGGSMTLKSSKDVGTTVTIVLPLEQEQR